jgi:hypothetical protein
MGCLKAKGNTNIRLHERGPCKVLRLAHVTRPDIRLKEKGNTNIRLQILAEIAHVTLRDARVLLAPGYQFCQLQIFE